MRSNFVIAGQKTSSCALFAVSNEILLSFYAAIAEAFPSTMILATSTIRKDPRISSVQYQQLYMLSLIQVTFLALLLGLVLKAKNEIKNRSTSCKRPHTK